MQRLHLVVRYLALIAAIALAGAGIFTLVVIAHAGPRVVAREAVDRGADRCGRGGDYDTWGTGDATTCETTTSGDDYAD